MNVLICVTQDIGNMNNFFKGDITLHNMPYTVGGNNGHLITKTCCLLTLAGQALTLNTN